MVSFLFMMIVTFAITMTFIFVCSPLYLRFGWLRWFYHDILGWHMPGAFTPIIYDGCSFHSKCKYCGKDIRQDGQGKWY